MIKLFTDGASSGNPGPGGWGAIIVSPDREVVELGGRDPQTTNNQMELTAAIEGIKSIFQGKKFSDTPIEVYTDSTYVIKGITLWLPNWKKRHWTTTTGKEIANLDLWQQLEQWVEQRKITWHYVKGHSGVAGNERADQIAVEYSLNYSPRLYTGSLDHYSINILDISSKGESGKTSSNKKRSGKPYSYLSLVNHIPMRHPDWKSCEARVKGTSGARFKKAMSKEEEAEILKSWGVVLK